MAHALRVRRPLFFSDPSVVRTARSSKNLVRNPNVRNERRIETSDVTALLKATRTATDVGSRTRM
jgi:hypothetical protein